MLSMKSSARVMTARVMVRNLSFLLPLTLKSPTNITAAGKAMLKSAHHLVV